MMKNEDDDLQDWNNGKVEVVLEDDRPRSSFVLGADGQGYPLPKRKIGFVLKAPSRRGRR